MRPLSLLTETLRIARSQPISTAVTALIGGAVCAVILATTAQTVQAERRVLSEIDVAGTRSIVISDTNGSAEISPDAVDRIAGLSGVEWAVGLGPATDVRSAGNPGSPPAAIRAIFGPLPPQVETVGRTLVPGSAYVGAVAQAELGLQGPIGGVAGSGGDVAVVGSLLAVDPLAFLNRSLVTVPGPGEATVRSIHVLAERPDDVARVADAALAVLGAVDRGSVGVETSERLAAIRSAVEGELGSFGRRLIAIVLSIGLVLVGLNVYGTVNNRKRDFGRRRALGASRPAIVALVALQTALVAAAGVAAGSAITVVVLDRVTGATPDWVFALAIGTLATLATGVASLPPAIVAAYRDPVSVLRVP